MTDDADELTDDEAVEHFRQQMQEAVDRAVAMHREGKSVEVEEKADGLHITATVSVLRDQLREVGSFLLDFPEDFSENLSARQH